MKHVITLVLFLCFLLIRSGNSHEVINHSDAPAISFMENHQLHLQYSSDQNVPKNIVKKNRKSNTAGNNQLLVLDHDSEDSQLWSNYHLQMAIFAGLICFYFLRIFPDHIQRVLPKETTFRNLQPIFISQRSLRI